MKKKVITGLIILAGAFLIAIFIGRQYNKESLDKNIEVLEKGEPVLNSYIQGQNLPEPVLKYFKRIFRSKIQNIRRVEIEQIGTIRTDVKSHNWMIFSANHFVFPMKTGFIWDSKIKIAPLLNLNVRDALIFGRGSGKISLFSAFPISEASNTAAINSGSLHRFLAESVWYPTALFPSSKLSWQKIDSDSALAILTDNGLTVSLEFRFNKLGEITGIFTPGRWGSFEDGYKQVPWEGHFYDYEQRNGILVPTKGEVGWYSGDELHLVWKGTITKISYEFEP